MSSKPLGASAPFLAQEVGEQRPDERAYLYTTQSVWQQEARFRELFPGLRGVDPDMLAQIEGGKIRPDRLSEGWAVVPNPTRVLGATAHSRVRTALTRFQALHCRHEFRLQNRLEDELTEADFSQTVHSCKCWEMISNSQGHADLLIVAFQFGLRHRGRSQAEAQRRFSKNEFEFGLFASVCMLMTYPYRLRHPNDLSIVAGDKVKHEGEFRSLTCIDFETYDDSEYRDTVVGWTYGSPSPYRGLATGFVRP